jgi:restriction system protein
MAAKILNLLCVFFSVLAVLLCGCEHGEEDTAVNTDFMADFTAEYNNIKLGGSVINTRQDYFAAEISSPETLAGLSAKYEGGVLSLTRNGVGATADDIIESTKDFILKELSRQLKGYDLEEFVADLLRAMGYRTTVSPHGGDSGIDITAYKDELPPRILVQVKSQDGDIKETTIQSLKGAMREGDYGLFVTLSNYTKNAQKYLDSTPIIRGINGTELVDLILKYYEDLSEKYRKMIPLKMVYIPVPREET